MLNRLTRLPFTAATPQKAQVPGQPRVVWMGASKVFPCEGIDSLAVPGAYIEIEEVCE